MQSPQFSFNPLPYTVLIQGVLYLTGLVYLWWFTPRSRVTHILTGMILFAGATVGLMFFVHKDNALAPILPLWLDVGIVALLWCSGAFAYHIPVHDQPTEARRALTILGGLVFLTLAFALISTHTWATTGQTGWWFYPRSRLAGAVAVVLTGIFYWRRFVHFSNLPPQLLGWPRLRALGWQMLAPPNTDVRTHRDLVVISFLALALVVIGPLRAYDRLNLSTSGYLVSYGLLIGSVAMANLYLTQFSATLVARVSAVIILAVLTLYNLTGIQQIDTLTRLAAGMENLYRQIQNQAPGPLAAAHLSIPDGVLYIVAWPDPEDSAQTQAAWIYAQPNQSLPDLGNLAGAGLPDPLPAGPLSNLRLTQIDLLPPTAGGVGAPGQVAVQREFIALGAQWIEVGRRADWTVRMGTETILRLLLPVLLAGLLAIFLAPLYLRAAVLRPLDQLLLGVRRANDGHLDLEIPVTRQDEIGYLTASFNTMIASIRQSQERLQEANTLLEETVTLRTEELQAALHETEAARRLAEMNATEADSASQAKGRFLAHMSHELRTPLNVILGYSELLSRDPTLSPQHAEQVEILNRSGDHLLSMINSVLDFSKIEAGHIEVDLQPVDLRDLIQGLNRMFRLPTQNKGLAFETVISPHVPGGVVIDAGKVRQVLINLLGNAVKFTETGSIHLKVALDPEPASGEILPGSPLLLHFRVHDSGSGIPTHRLPTIFKPFQHAQGRQRPQEGAGLGLAISREFIEIMGGQIWVESQVGEGTTFHFTLPAQVTQRPIPARTTIPLQGEPRLAGQDAPPRLLVVEDYPANRSLLVTILTRMGFAVREASDGQEGVEIWRSWRPDLIWMDLQLPVLDGAAAIQQIRKEEGDHRPVIVVLTAGVLVGDPLAQLPAGCDDYLAKPYRRRQIVAALQRHLHVRFDFLKSAAPLPRMTVGPEGKLTPPGTSADQEIPQLIHDMRNNLSVIFGCVDQIAVLAQESRGSALDDYVDLLESRTQALAQQLTDLAVRQV